MSDYFLRIVSCETGQTIEVDGRSSGNRPDIKSTLDDHFMKILNGRYNYMMKPTKPGQLVNEEKFFVHTNEPGHLCGIHFFMLRTEIVTQDIQASFMKGASMEKKVVYSYKYVGSPELSVLAEKEKLSYE